MDGAELKHFNHTSSSYSSNSSLLISFTIEEITGFTNEVTKAANKAPRNPTFFISFFTVSVTPSINTPEFSNDNFYNITHIFI